MGQSGKLPTSVDSIESRAALGQFVDKAVAGKEGGGGYGSSEVASRREGTTFKMTEKEAVDAAYAAAVQKLFAALFDTYVQTTAPEGRGQAEQRFLNGINLARTARDRAKTLLDQNA